MRYDAIVIGAGPGGYVAAIRLGQLGKKVLVVEKRFVGGVCLNVGCIPTKALIHAAHLIHEFDYAKKSVGLNVEYGGFDLEKVNSWKEKIVDRLVRGVKTLWKANGVEWKAGEAKLLDANRVEVTDDSGKKEVYEAQYIILATGSRPTFIKGFEADGERVWSSDDAVSFKSIPKRLIVLGAGAIGLEFAYVYRYFGSEVEVYELMPQILPGTDMEMANELEKALKRQGIKIFTNSKATSLRRSDEGVEMDVVVNGEEKKVSGDVLLVAVGRRPNYEGLNLEGVGVDVDERGFVKVDKERRTSISNIFAIGDLTGPPLLAHKASREGIVAAEVIAGESSLFEPRAIPAVVYTEPQLASVGLSEEEAQERGIGVHVGKFPIIANGKALSMGETVGLAKLVVDSKTDEVVGVHVLGPEASSLIGEGVVAIEMGATAEDIGLSIHPHPTLSEILMEAAENVHKRAIHIVNR